jgi:hypothetical protein
MRRGPDPIMITFYNAKGDKLRELALAPGARILIDDSIDRWMPNVARVIVDSTTRTGR